MPQIGILAEQIPCAAAVITAAGSGSRLGSDLPKAIVQLNRVPMVARAALQIAKSQVVSFLVITAPKVYVTQMARCVKRYLQGAGLYIPVTVVPGGESRQASVYAGIEVVADARENGMSAEVVIVHDAARPMVPVTLIRNVVSAVQAGHEAVIPGIAIVDTVKQVDKIVSTTDEYPQVISTIDRQKLVAVQTPQAFRFETLWHLHNTIKTQGQNETTAFSDDAGMAEYLDIPVAVVPGDSKAMKVTTKQDLEFIEFLVQKAKVWQT